MLKSISKSQMVAEKLRHEIETQIYPSNSMLPSEHQLAAHFNINRLTLRKALESLEAEGIIIRRQGVGTFVASPAKKQLAEGPGKVGMEHFAILADGKISEYDNLQLSMLQQVFWEQGCFAPIILEKAVCGNPYCFAERLHALNCRGVMVYLNNYNKMETWLKFLRSQGFVCAIPRYVAGFGECYPGTEEEYGRFTEMASENAVNFLAGLGHRRIAFLADSTHELGDYSIRLNGYLSGMERNGLPGCFHRVSSICTGAWEESLFDLVCKQNCTALMLFNDSEAMLAIKLLEYRKIRVPEEVSIIGYGSFYRQELGYLTTIPVPLDQFSLELYRLLKAAAAGESYSHRTTPYLVRIQKGITCAPPPAEIRTHSIAKEEGC